MKTSSLRKINPRFDIFSILFGIASFLTIGFFYPPMATIPLGLITGVLAVKRNSRHAGLVINILALIVYGAWVIFWYEFGKDFRPL